MWVIPSLLLLGACSKSTEPAELFSVADGRWTTGCILRQDLFGSWRIILDLEQAENVMRREYYFADPECREALTSLTYRGRYELIVTARDFIYAIDFVYDTQALEALNADGQQLMEQNDFCGRQNWPLAEAQTPLRFDSTYCPAVGPVPVKNLNLVQIRRGYSLEFGSDLAHENERPIEVQNAPQLIFLSQPSP